MGRVLEEVAGRSTVELESHYRKQLEPKTFQFVIEKQGDFYRVLSRKQVANAGVNPLAIVPPVTAVPSATAPAAADVEQAPVSSEAASEGPSSATP